MKRLLTATCLTAALVIMTGCQGAKDDTTSTTSAPAVATTNANMSSADDAPEAVKVTLKVPGMS